ncbi:MAG: hypothetical protein ACI9WO_001196 [Sphingobacteriales bacterium]|jgi:hypothetical protein
MFLDKLNQNRQQRLRFLSIQIDYPLHLGIYEQWCEFGRISLRNNY